MPGVPPNPLPVMIRDANPDPQNPILPNFPEPIPGPHIDQDQGILTADAPPQPIVFVREISGGSGEEKVTSGEVTQEAWGEYLHEYTRLFLVRTTGPGVGSMSVRLAADPVTGLRVPRVWETYVSFDGNNTDEESLCVRLRPQQDAEDPQTWVVAAEYSSDCPDPSVTSDHPLDQPSDITWDQEELEVAMTQDALGVAVLNSAGVAYDPPPTVKEAYLTLHVTRNEASYNHNFFADFVNTVNGDPFFGFEAGEVWCRKISGRRMYHNGIIYWQVSYQFAISRKRDPLTQRLIGWTLRILDQGTAQVVANKIIQVQPRGIPATHPLLLNGAGGLLGVGGTPVYRSFQPYPFKAFNDLALP